MSKQPAKGKLFLVLVVLMLLATPMLTILSGCSAPDKVEIQKTPEPNQQAAKPSEEELKQQVAEAQKRQQALDKQKRLDEKYQTAYQAFHAKKRNEAITLADEIILEDANYYQAYNIKGIALCFSGQFTKGMENIDKSLSIKPDFGYALFNKALAYEYNGQFSKALEWYDKALQVENYIWSYYGKASIYGRRGDVANTVKYLQIAISMDSSVKEVAREETDFNPVKNSKEFQALVK